MKANSKTLQKLENLLKDAGYIIRYEKGNFNAGYCILEDKKIIVINKFFHTEMKVESLLQIATSLSFNLSTLSDESKKTYSQISQLKIENL